MSQGNFTIDSPVLVGLYLDLIQALGDAGQPPSDQCVETCTAYVLAAALVDHDIQVSGADALLVGNMDIGVRGLKIFGVDVRDNRLSTLVAREGDGLVVSPDGLTLLGELADELPFAVRSLASAVVSMVASEGTEGIRERTLNKLGRPRNAVGWCSLSDGLGAAQVGQG